MKEYTSEIKLYFVGNILKANKIGRASCRERV